MKQSCTDSDTRQQSDFEVGFPLGVRRQHFDQTLVAEQQAKFGPGREGTQARDHVHEIGVAAADARAGGIDQYAFLEKRHLANPQFKYSRRTISAQSRDQLIRPESKSRLTAKRPAGSSSGCSGKRVSSEPFRSH